MRRMNWDRAVVVMAASFAGVLAPVSSAQHLEDIAVGVRDGRLALGVFFVQGESTVPLLTERVFRASFDPLSPTSNFTDEPGFESLEGTFAPGLPIGYTLQSSLRRWNGSAFVPTGGERLQTRLGGIDTVRVSSLDGTPVVGTSRLVTPFGEFHQHLGFTLLDPASTGVYVIEMRLWASGGSPIESESFWMVFDKDDPEGAQGAVAALKAGEAVGACAADLNGDGLVDDADFTFFVVAYDALVCPPPGCPYDFDGSGTVDDADFSVFAVQYDRLLCP
ncbi:MAG: hypothetical protein K2Y21_15515 [Phycisphaerales bacterium]|nr:hypothetical protein [Phycisphaerales bacterium]